MTVTDTEETTETETEEPAAETEELPPETEDEDEPTDDPGVIAGSSIRDLKALFESKSALEDTKNTDTGDGLTEGESAEQSGFPDCVPKKTARHENVVGQFVFLGENYSASL